MIRLRRWSVVCFVMVVAAGFTAADDQSPAAAKPGEEKWLVDRALTISPRAEPEPALKYRLLPPVKELRDGNAVPIYLRMGHELYDSYRRSIIDTPTKWNELPLDQVPLADARKFLDGVQAKFLGQIDYGARRKTAEWNYTLEQSDPISILLPDAQQMRGYAPMVVLSARVQIAERNYVLAARSFETGFAFGRHVANGPFLINSLVGMNIINQLIDRIPEWIEQPNAPNLYWSLTALPRPLIDLRNQMEFEQWYPEMQFPDLADLNRQRSAAEWDAALKRFRSEVKRIDPMLHMTEGLAPNTPTPPPTANPPTPPPTAAKRIELPPTDPDEPAARSPDLAAAREFVADQSGKTVAEVTAMPPAQILLITIAGTYADRRDDLFKITYLPFPQAHALTADTLKRLHDSTGGEGVRLARLFLPAIAKVMTVQNRLERKIALMRTIEALRLHAAAHGGQLPESLDQATAAPVPLDPGTDKPFEYHRDGATATISSRLPGEPLETTGLRYRLTIRK